MSSIRRKLVLNHLEQGGFSCNVSDKSWWGADYPDPSFLPAKQKITIL
jgi:hypothetical protein